MRKHWIAVVLAGLTLATVMGSLGHADEERFVTLASTTSTENSGLLGYLVPRFALKTGITVRVVAVGTGRAISLAERGDADLLLVHHRPSEDAFMRDGFGIERRAVMYNDFVIAGPSDDPAGLAGLIDPGDAMRAIAKAGAVFVSRGDDSGTHKKELELWSAAGVKPEGAWYREIGAGMGAALNTASAMGAYLLVDRGTWLSFQNKTGMALLFEGYDSLFNPYGILLVNPERHPHVKEADARRFMDWITSDIGQRAIASFKIDGEQAFFPNAGVEEDTPDVSEVGDVELGEKVAHQTCARCHVVSDRNRFGGIGSTPSFFALRTLPGWEDRFAAFWTLNPHPSFTQVEGITEPFSPQRPPPIAPIELTLEEVEAVTAYAAKLAPADLGQGLESR